MIKKRSTIARLQRIGHISTTALLLGSFIGTTIAAPLLNIEHVQAAEGLAEVSILSGASLTSTVGNDLTPNKDGNYDLSLKYSGQGLANVGLADKKVLIFALPPELQGKVVGGANVAINAQLLPITPGDIPTVKPLLATLKTAVTALANAAKLLGVNIDSVETAVADLQKAQSLGTYSETLPATVSGDGKSISVDFTDGLGKYASKAYGDLFTPLKTAINGLHFDGALSSLNALLTPVKTAANGLFAVTDAIGNGTSNVLNESIHANILGTTSGTLTTTVSDPKVKQATVAAAAVNNATIDVGLISSGGSQVTLNFANSSENPLKDYVVNQPTIDKVTAGDTKVTGQVALTKPIPDGTTFEAIVTLADGSKEKATVDADGKYSITIPAAKAGDNLSVVIEATNGSNKKQGAAAQTEVVGATEEDPLKDYVVAKPEVDKVTAGDTKVTGQVTLNKPIPDGTTFEAIVTLADGSKEKATVDADGKYSITIPAAKAGDNLSVIVEATNGNSKKQSEATQTEVAGATEEDPLKDYVVAKPEVDKVTADDTKVTGQVTLNKPIPDGTTFEAIVTLADGSKEKATVDADGKYSITIPAAKAGDNLSVIVEATNGSSKKQSDATQTEVVAKTAEDPLKDYTVAKPDVDKVTAGDTKVTGQVNLTKPIPDGTTFEAIVTLADGSKEKATVDADGKYSITIPAAKAGDKLSVIVEASNGDNKKQSDATNVEVAEKTAEDPLKDYTVAKPDVDKVVDGDKKVTGEVNLTKPIPDGTTFEAIVTLADGSKEKATVDSDGKYSITIPTAKAGDKLSVIIEASNGDNKKQSDATNVEVAEKTAEDPLKDYTVAKPTVDKVTAGDDTVKGSVELNKPIPDGTTFDAIVTLADGSKEKATVDSDGNFSIKVDPVKAGDKLSVIIEATNGDSKKQSDPTNVEVAAKTAEDPLKDYTVAKPDVDKVTDGDKKVTGEVNLTKPIPDGTTFEAIVTLADGSKEKGTVDADGKYSITIPAAKAGDKLSVVIEASNGDSKKQSDATNVEVAAKTAEDPLKDYTVTKPTVDKVTAGDDAVKGSVELTKPIPDGTKFEAVVTLADGSKEKATVDSDGKFSIKVDPVKAGDKLSVIIEATNGDSKKQSDATNVEVAAKATEDPLKDYTVAKPEVDKVTDGDKKVTGQVTLDKPIPAGTDFEAIVTLADGSKEKATVDSDGKFSIKVDPVKAGDKLSVLIEATNGDSKKQSDATNVEVAAKNAEDPLKDYMVAQPTVDRVTAGDDTIKGSVDLIKPIPAGTTFEAIVTLPDGSKEKATVDSDGKFSIKVDPVKAGDKLSVMIEATNGNDKKQSAATEIEVAAKNAEDPFKDYTVAKPTVDPVKAGDKTVTGSVDLNKPIPAGANFEAIVTLPDGSQKKATVDSDGKFSVTIPEAKAGDKLSVMIEATKGSDKKQSAATNIEVAAKATENPLKDYTVAAPTIDPIKAGDKVVTGSVDLGKAIPNGTKFEAIVKLPDGSTAKAQVDSNGKFSVKVDPVKAGDKLTVLVEATNGNDKKQSAPVTVEVGKATNSDPLKDHQVATPTVDPIKPGDTQITGSIKPNGTVPKGTTYEAVVTLPDGSQHKAKVTADGKFKIKVKPLKAGTKLAVFIEATNGQSSKRSRTVTVTVGKSTRNPLVGHKPAKPTVNPIKAGAKTVTGRVKHGTLPNGTQVGVVGALADGTKFSGRVDSNGRFHANTRTLGAGEKVTLATVLTHGTNQQRGATETATVGNGTGGMTGRTTAQTNQDYGQTNPKSTGTGNLPQTDELIRSGIVVGVIGLLTAGIYGLYRWFKH